MHTISRILVLSAVLGLLAAPGGARAEVPPQATAEAHDGRHDFDFLHGTWKLRIRRLKSPLTGSKEWIDLTGTAMCRPIWGGHGNVEEDELEGPSGRFNAFTVRLYSLTTRQWSLNWVSSRKGFFEPVSVGEFKNGRGEFYDQELYEGRSILVRGVWSGITRTSAHFEQSFSTDGGKTWEANWIADLIRAEQSSTAERP